jgi:hypothetical protein
MIVQLMTIESTREMTYDKVKHATNWFQ